MEMNIDEKYGDNLVACNERTMKELGLKYKGRNVILDVRLADDVMACNKRTYEELQKCQQSPVEPREGVISEPEGKSEGKITGHSRDSLFALKKKEQLDLLGDLGVSLEDIKKLRFEKDRVDRILELLAE